MKDVGSIFPLYDEHLECSQKTVCLPSNYDGQILYSLCREALLDIAKTFHSSTKRVLLPAYTCQTVIDPFKQLGWEIGYYPINKNLKIDITSLLSIATQMKPEIVVAHPYYGMELAEEEQEVLLRLKESGVIIIIDNTQCIFSEQRLPFVDYYLGSYRKWLCCPDGAFLEYNRKGLSPRLEADENVEFVQKQMDAMYLRGEYFNHSNEIVKQISIRLNKDAVRSISGKITPHSIGTFSKIMLGIEDIKSNITRRIQNYTTLFEGLKNSDTCEVACGSLKRVTTAPLYFPIYVEDRLFIQTKLAQHHIYAPILWPVITKEILINSTIEYMYNHLLAIPCDQRYDTNDMQRIVRIISECNEKS